MLAWLQWHFDALSLRMSGSEFPFGQRQQLLSQRVSRLMFQKCPELCIVGDKVAVLSVRDLLHLAVSLLNGKTSLNRKMRTLSCFSLSSWPEEFTGSAVAVLSKFDQV